MSPRTKPAQSGCPKIRSFLAVMPTNLSGPGDNYDLMNSHVIPAMLRKFHLAKLAMEKNWPAIEADERRHGPIPEDIKPDLYATCFEGRPPRVVLWGTGTPRRKFLYNDDMADACIYLMNLPDDQFDQLLRPAPSLEPCTLPLAPLVNIGTGTDITIRELAELVRQVVGYEGEIVFDASKPDGTPRKVLYVSRITAMGWQAKHDLAAGLVKAYKNAW